MDLAQFLQGRKSCAMTRHLGMDLAALTSMSWCPVDFCACDRPWVVYIKSMSYIFAIIAIRACLTAAALWRCQVLAANFATAKSENITLNFGFAINAATGAAVYAALAVAGAVVFPKWFLLLGL